MDKDEHITQITAEAVAIGQMYDDQRRELLIAKKTLVLKDKAINDLNEQIQKLLKEKEDMKKELDDVRNTLAQMASDAQH
jgi:predicted  nucleic acid-binding Zn-ribbon protein